MSEVTEVTEATEVTEVTEAAGGSPGRRVALAEGRHWSEGGTGRVVVGGAHDVHLVASRAQAVRMFTILRG